MRVLVAVASRHGSTRQIAEAMADVLRVEGFTVHVTDPDRVQDLAGYRAVIVGSAVYVGRWAASARAMVDRLAPSLAERPVWLFSSGPVGTPPSPLGDADEVSSIMVRLGARGHRTFAGCLDLSVLGVAERAVVALVRAQEGDFRQWDDVEDWARQVANELHTEVARAHRSAG